MTTKSSWSNKRPRINTSNEGVGKIILPLKGQKTNAIQQTEKQRGGNIQKQLQKV